MKLNPYEKEDKENNIGNKNSFNTKTHCQRNSNRGGSFSSEFHFF